MSSPYPNLSPQGERLFDPSAIDKDMQIERLRAEFETGLRIIAQKDMEIARLKEHIQNMMDEAMKIFATYLNVPESRALQERWDSLKNAP